MRLKFGSSHRQALELVMNLLLIKSRINLRINLRSSLFLSRDNLFNGQIQFWKGLGDQAIVILKPIVLILPFRV